MCADALGNASKHCLTARRILWGIRRSPCLVYGGGMKAPLVLAPVALFVMAAMACPAQAQAIAPVEQLNQQDVRLATLAERMFAANNALCRTHMPLTGLILHSRDQYGPAEAQARFAEARVAVAQVLPGSAAEQAGVRAGDAVVSIGGTSMFDLQPEPGGLLRNAAFALLANGGALVTHRNGLDLAPQIGAPTGCRGLAEIRISNSMNARTDGRIIQVDYALASSVDDPVLAVVFAHEFAHLVLDHDRRLHDAGVSTGLLAQFGRNGRLNRQMEDEADRLSVHLLANAGFDPAIAPALWRSEQGRKLAGGLLRGGTHPSANARAEALEREIEERLPDERPSIPAHLLMLRGD